MAFTIAGAAAGLGAAVAALSAIDTASSLYKKVFPTDIAKAKFDAIKAKIDKARLGKFPLDLQKDEYDFLQKIAKFVPDEIKKVEVDERDKSKESPAEQARRKAREDEADKFTGQADERKAREAEAAKLKPLHDFLRSHRDMPYEDYQKIIKAEHNAYIAKGGDLNAQELEDIAKNILSVENKNINTNAESDVTQHSLATPEQQDIMSRLGKLGVEGLEKEHNNEVSFSPFANEARRNFATTTLPGIAERFTSKFGPGSQQSSAFGQQLGGAGAELESTLARLGAAHKTQQQEHRKSLYHNAISSALTPTVENVYHPPQKNTTQDILKQFGELIGTHGDTIFNAIRGLGSRSKTNEQQVDQTPAANPPPSIPPYGVQQQPASEVPAERAPIDFGQSDNAVESMGRPSTMIDRARGAVNGALGRIGVGPTPEEQLAIERGEGAWEPGLAQKYFGKGK